MELEVNGKEYDVKVAKTDEERQKGLSNKKELPQNEGMLFVFDTPEEVSFWMKDTLIPLDIIFIDKDKKVIRTYAGIPNDETFLTEDNVLYVLEVNINSGIVTGDEIEFELDEESDDDNKYVLKILNQDGSVQMNLEGGERIFSRKHSKRIIELAKKADLSKSDKDYRSLGRTILKYIDIQENADPEYVDIKK